MGKHRRFAVFAVALLMTFAAIAPVLPARAAEDKVLYTTKMNVRAPFYAEPSAESKLLFRAPKGAAIEVFEVEPTWAKARYKNSVGYVKRTSLSENFVALDPENTIPYGVVLHPYMAQLTEEVNLYAEPNADSEVLSTVYGGAYISFLGLVDGFAKVSYRRKYAYIDATKMTDLVMVSPTTEPLSDETPIAAYTSFYAHHTGDVGNEGRCLNIVHSCSFMTRVLQPGEQFNFNKQVGPYTKGRGYHLAPVLIDGKAKPGYGGGTCQSSSTLYNTVRQLPGIAIVYRRPHGPGGASYLPIHQDAAVGNETLNFIIRNDYDFPVRIVASAIYGALCIRIYKGDGSATAASDSSADASNS